jgi:cysteine desulfurase/selenocysteine lyase
MEISESRKLFPHIEKGIIYFNHASTAPLNKKAIENINKYITEFSEAKLDDNSNIIKALREAKNNIALMINSSSDRIAFTDNTSNGLNILAQGMKWKKGDRILLNDVEFPSNVYPFLNLKREGIEIDFVRAKNGIVTAEEVIENLKPETKLVSISQVQFLSGYRVDLEKIGKVYKEKGIIFSVDAIQGLGAIGLDVIKGNIDFISSGTHKWLLGLHGLGFIYLSKQLQEKLEPRHAGWLSVEKPNDRLNYQQKFKLTASRFQTGVISFIGVYAFNASMQIFKEIGFEKIEKQIIENSQYFINELGKIGIDPVLKGLDDKYLAGIVSFKHSEEEKIFNRLSGKNIHFSLREGFVRLSPHFYNTKEEIDIVIAEIKKLKN